MTSDPQEQARLAQLYAGMTPEELQKIADDAGSLTNMARQALVEEIDRRGLGNPLTEASGEDVIEKRNLVSIRRFRDLPEALLAKMVSSLPESNVFLPMTTWCGWTGLFRICSAGSSCWSTLETLKMRSRF